MTDGPTQAATQAATQGPPYFADDRHALYAGAILGIGMKYGIPLSPVVDDQGNFTDRFTLALEGGAITITLVVPPPPDEWTMASWQDS